MSIQTKTIKAMLCPALMAGIASLLSCANVSAGQAADTEVADSTVVVADSLSEQPVEAYGYDTTRYESYISQIALNGVTLTYEVKGKGRPVLLLHGNGGSHTDLDSIMNVLARSGYRVYGIDSRGQGANKPLKEYHYADMAEDIHQLIDSLGLGKPAIYGWSDGGNTALQLEVMYPGSCALIVTSGANIFPDGWGGHANIQKRIAQDQNPKPLRKMLYYEPTMTWADMKTIACPALICAGEHDVILRQHTQTIADSIPGAQLHIEKGANHTSYVKHSTKVAKVLLDFLRANQY